MICFALVTFKGTGVIGLIGALFKVIYLIPTKSIPTYYILKVTVACTVAKSI